MSRFYDKRSASPKFKAALQALADLLKDEGYGAVEHVHAEVVAEYLEQSYVERYQLKQSSVLGNCLCRLVGKICPWKYGSGKSCVTLDRDAVDHTTLWNRTGKPFVYISQPYGLSLEGMRSIVEMCDKYELDADIDGTSWHYPNSTLLIEIHHRGWRKAVSHGKE